MKNKSTYIGISIAVILLLFFLNKIPNNFNNFIPINERLFIPTNQEFYITLPDEKVNIEFKEYNYFLKLKTPSFLKINLLKVNNTPLVFRHIKKNLWCSLIRNNQISSEIRNKILCNLDDPENISQNRHITLSLKNYLFEFENFIYVLPVEFNELLKEESVIKNFLKFTEYLLFLVAILFVIYFWQNFTKISKRKIHFFIFIPLFILMIFVLFGFLVNSNLIKQFTPIFQVCPITFAVNRITFLLYSLIFIFCFQFFIFSWLVLKNRKNIITLIECNNIFGTKVCNALSLFFKINVFNRFVVSALVALFISMLFLFLKWKILAELFIWLSYFSLISAFIARIKQNKC